MDPLPSASSSSYGESFCSPVLGVDGTLVSCSFLKAAAGNSSWWQGCWWHGGGATSAFYLVLRLASRDQRTVSLVERYFIHPFDVGGLTRAGGRHCLASWWRRWQRDLAR